MSTQERLIFLIRKAGSIVGSEYKLAKVLGVDQQTLSAWKAERRKCMPPDRARLAGFARENALSELVLSTVEQNQGTIRGEQLRIIFEGFPEFL